MSTEAHQRDWNDLSKVKPEIKEQPNDRQRSDHCWVLLKDGSINSGQYFEVDGKGTFGFKKSIVTHWAYRDVPPPLPKGFKPKKIDYSKLEK